MAEPLILALDQGTTSTRAILFDAGGRALAEAGRPLEQFYPADGWVEHDAEAIFQASVEVLREAVAKAARSMVEVAAIGVTNQRETVVVWDKATGKPIHKATSPSGRTAAPPASLRHFARRAATNRGSPRSPASCSIPISQGPRSPGYWTRWRARGPAPRPANCWPAPWTPG